MELDEIEALARRGDNGKAACAIRLRAARHAAELTQKDVADRIGRRTTAVSAMENGVNFPSFEIMRFYWRNHRIDFNFLMIGDVEKLPADVLDRLGPALREAADAWDQKAR